MRIRVKSLGFVTLLICMVILAASVRAEDLHIVLSDGLTIEFVHISSGSFTIGSPLNEPGREESEGPQRRIGLKTAFYMKKTPVTQGEWLAIMKDWPDSDPNQQPSEERGMGFYHPAYFVNWFDAIRFCNELSRIQGLQPAYHVNAEGARAAHWGRDAETIVTWDRNANGYRLPTEAEWEYAARAGTNTIYFWGNEPNHDYAWMRDNSGGKTQPVGQKLPNAFGLHDMVGNIQEWCWNEFNWNAYSDSADPYYFGDEGERNRATRGGFFGNSWQFLRSASRRGEPPFGCLAGLVGFRVVRTSE